MSDPWISRARIALADCEHPELSDRLEDVLRRLDARKSTRETVALALDIEQLKLDITEATGSKMPNPELYKAVEDAWDSHERKRRQQWAKRGQRSPNKKTKAALDYLDANPTLWAKPWSEVSIKLSLKGLELGRTTFSRESNARKTR